MGDAFRQRHVRPGGLHSTLLLVVESMCCVHATVSACELWLLGRRWVLAWWHALGEVRDGGASEAASGMAAADGAA